MYHEIAYLQSACSKTERFFINWFWTKVFLGKTANCVRAKEFHWTSSRTPLVDKILMLLESSRKLNIVRFINQVSVIMLIPFSSLYKDALNFCHWTWSTKCLVIVFNFCYCILLPQLLLANLTTRRLHETRFKLSSVFLTNQNEILVKFFPAIRYYFLFYTTNTLLCYDCSIKYIYIYLSVSLLYKSVY